PFNLVPQATQQVLFNSNQPLATPNTVVFSGANGNAITVSDPDGNVSVTTSVMVNPGSGTLTLGSTANVTVTGNGTSAVTVGGTASAVTAALEGLVFRPANGFYGTTPLVVNTSDNGNTGFGGPLTDVRSAAIQVVGLYISEIFFDDGSNSTVAGNLNEYVEV